MWKNFQGYHFDKISLKSASCQTANSTLSVRASKEPQLKGLKTTLQQTGTKNGRKSSQNQIRAKKFFVCLFGHSCKFLIFHHQVDLDLSIQILLMYEQKMCYQLFGSYIHLKTIFQSENIVNCSKSINILKIIQLQKNQFLTKTLKYFLEFKTVLTNEEIKILIIQFCYL